VLASTPFRSHRLPGSSSWIVGKKTPVISSQVPHHRLHLPAPRGPFHEPLVAVTQGQAISKPSSVQANARRASILLTASPLGEEELVPVAVERGGYLPIPRRDTRAGEWVPGDASAEPDWPQRPERPEGSESLSVTGSISSDERSV